MGAATLYLVRHAHAAAGFGDAVDPPLSELGRQQASGLVGDLGTSGPLPMITSPLLRARETAAALEEHWRTMATVEPGVAEIPTPTDDLSDRQEWLRDALGSTWTGLGPRYRSWRDTVALFLTGIRTDTVIVTHFVAINAAIGAATGDDRVVCAALDNASVTTMRTDGDGLMLVTLGSLIAQPEVG